MLYRPNEGRIWDPTVVFYQGKYYLFTMFFNEEGRDSFYMRLAVSEDAVHWEDRGCVIDGGKNPVWKMNIHKLKEGGFGLNHGSMSFKPGHGNDTLIYYTSKDLINWNYTGENHPDPRWYDEEERWDHMAVIPSEEGGYIGYVVATPKKEIGGMIGIQRSDDGINWRTCEPPKIDWDGCEAVREMEVGGCEKIGDKWYLIGGICPPFEGNYSYSCYTFTSENENGPFKPDKEALRLCGFNGRQGDLFVQALVCFVRNYENDEKLVTNSIIYEYDDKFRSTWLLPLKRACVENGHLFLKYYGKNEALKGKMLSNCVAQHVKTKFVEGYMLTDQWKTVRLGEYDINKGCVIEAEVTINPYPERGPVRAGAWRPTLCGFSIGEAGEEAGEMADSEEKEKFTAILSECTCSKNRRTTIGKLFTDGDGDEKKFKYEPEDVIYPGCACPTGMDTGVKHNLRLLIRYGMFEFYQDDYFVQSYTTKDLPLGNVNFTVVNGDCYLDNVKIFEMEI